MAFGLGMGKLGLTGGKRWNNSILWPLGAASPGMWIDPSTTTASYQDSAGTTALSAIGTVLDTSNPVGLVLDRKGGLVLGPELVTNGDFSNGTTGWTVEAGWTFSGGKASASGSAGYLYQTGGAAKVVGKTYKYTFTVSDYVSGNVTPYINSVLPPVNFNSNGEKTVYFVAINTSPEQGFTPPGAGASFSIDNISVKEIPGIHLSQDTSTSRPVASARKNELVGTAALATQNVTTTAIPYTISFGGAGTVTASGAHVGALTNGQTFTPTAGTLTLTIAGSVTTAQLERGSAVTPYQRVTTASDYDASVAPIATKFDGVDDALASATFAAGTIPGLTDCLIAVRRDSAAATYLISDTVSRGFFEWESGDTNRPDVGAGMPTYLVDGAAITATRGALFTALAAGSWHILEARGLDLTTWTALGVSSFVSYRLNGGLGGIQLFASGQDANRDLARAQMAAYFGVTLP